MQYTPLISPDDKTCDRVQSAEEEKFLPELRKYYYDPTQYKTYLEELGIQYPTVKK